MKLLVRNIKRILRLYYAIKLGGVIQLLKNYNSKSSNVILVHSYFKGYFMNSLEHDFVLASVFVNLRKDYRFVLLKNVNTIKNSFVVFNPHEEFGQGNVNYSKHLSGIVKSLEERNNKVFYSSSDIEWWENKAFMHRKFEELNIQTPQTFILPLLPFEKEKQLPLSFPFLIKEEHSCASEGVHKVNNQEEFNKVIESASFISRNENIIIQRLVSMHKDLRVILIRSEIVLHYWRVNTAKEWKPTSTSHGSKVDFVTFPEKWKKKIIENFEKLNIVTGAFDITWENDDLETEPIFLEVSPSYQPNPPYEVESLNLSYGKWKKALLFRNSWDFHYIKIIYEMKYKILRPLIIYPHSG